jgi:hypothetical protein
MELSQILELDEGAIDVWIVMEGGSVLTSVIDPDLGPRGNYIRFTPNFTRKGKVREQNIDGDYDVSRSAIIFDDGFFEGHSLNETLEAMESLGYNQDRVYAFYVLGYKGDRGRDSPHYMVRTIEKVKDMQRIIEENNRLLSG